MSMIAVGAPGRFTTLPDFYMRKMAVGPRARGAIDLLRPVGDNIEAIAEAFGRRVNDVTTIVLDRPRHHDLIEEIRNSGARIKLIQDGDVTAAISAAIRGTNDHLAIGIGGTRQAVLSAAALVVSAASCRRSSGRPRAGRSTSCGRPGSRTTSASSAPRTSPRAR
jgi:fructose-1,6-bisphosphatase/sedoheptulose 1,7-bisphosphatase-like protein